MRNFGPNLLKRASGKRSVELQAKEKNTKRKQIREGGSEGGSKWLNILFQNLKFFRPNIHASDPKLSIKKTWKEKNPKISSTSPF